MSMIDQQIKTLKRRLIKIVHLNIVFSGEFKKKWWWGFDGEHQKSNHWKWMSQTS